MNDESRIKVFNHGMITGACGAVFLATTALYVGGGVCVDYKGWQLAIIAASSCGAAFVAWWRGIKK